MSIIFFILASLSYFWLNYYKPKFGLKILLFLLPTYLWRVNIFGIPTTFLEVMIMSGVLVFIIKNWLGLKENIKKRFKGQLKGWRYPFDIEMILVVVVALVAAGVAGFNSSALGIYKAYFLEPVFLAILIFNYFGRETKWRELIMPLVYSGIIVSLFGWYQGFFDLTLMNPKWGAAPFNRITSFFDNPNAVGLFLVPIILLAVVLVKPKWDKRKTEKDGEMLVLFGFLLLAVGAIALAKSDGAIMALGAGLFLEMMLMDKKKRLMAGVLAVICLVSIVSFAPLKNKMIENLTLSNLSGEIRKQQWRETWQMLTDGRIIWGGGLSNYQEAVKPYHVPGIYFNFEKDQDFRRKIVIFDDNYKADHWQPTEIYKYPHNILLNFWTELGLLGVLVFVWVIGKYLTIGVKLLKVAKGEDRLMVIGLVCAMVAIVIHGLVDVPYFKNDLSAMFWVLVMMMGMVNYRMKNKLNGS